MLGGQDKGIAAAVGDAVLLTCLKATKGQKGLHLFFFSFFDMFGKQTHRQRLRC